MLLSFFRKHHDAAASGPRIGKMEAGRRIAGELAEGADQVRLAVVAAVGGQPVPATNPNGASSW